jgi:putative ATP-binding cassette transporter
VLASVVYTIIIGSLAYFSVRGLVRAVGRKNEAEGRFLAEMTRLRENAESIAFIRGDNDEERSVLQTYEDVISAWVRQIQHNGLISNVQSAKIVSRVMV